MRNLKVAFLFCLASSIAHAQEVIELNKPLKCGEAQFVMNHFLQEYNERPLWVGKDNSSNSHITLLVNKEKRSWTLVQYDAKIACVLGAGDTSSSVEVF